MNVTTFDVQETAFMLLAQLCTQKVYKHKKYPTKNTKTNEDRLQEAKELLIRAFDSTELYVEHLKKKKSGGYRKIHEPPPDLKEVQRYLLKWLSRIVKRTDYYRTGYAGWQAWRGLSYTGVAEHFLKAYIHGSRQKRSVASAVQVHTQANDNYVVEFDFKDAFPSVKKDQVASVLEKIISTEFKSYFVTYKDKDARKSGVRYRDFSYLACVDGFTQIAHQYFQKGLNDAYARFPLFSNKECPELRKLVRQQANIYEKYEDTCFIELANVLADLLSQLAVYQDSIPQGAPMSGLLLNLVVSSLKYFRPQDFTYVSSVSIYVDNIILTMLKKPTEEFLNSFENSIDRTEIFKANREKTKVFDLRNQTAPLLGMKLVLRPAKQNEIDHIRSGEWPKGFERAQRTDRKWMIKHTTLSKNIQKKYRSMIHKAIVSDVDGKYLDKVHGCVGHIVSVYGWSTTNMPSCLSKVVHSFRDKYKLNNQ